MSSTSLYGNVGNVTVSSKNLTTLYNATTGNTVVANVPDRNFTTLYAAANQTDIKPTRAYGNSNVEAFLNAGTDGANSVQNIVMHGNITVGKNSYLGNAGNVHITGGQLNYVLATDGGGGLFWTAQSQTTPSIVPYIHFDVSTTANNQQFTDSLIDNYASNLEMNVMKNGVNIEPDFYEKISNTTIQINIPLSSGDTIDILATGSGGGGEPAGNVYEVQYNGSGVFAANSSFTFDQANSLLTVGNISTGDVLANTGNIANFDTVNSNISNLNITTSAILGDVGNISIGGGSNGQYLTTDGSGVLSWTTGAGGTPTSLNANIGNVIINGGSNSQVLTTYGNGTLHWTTISGGGSNAVGGSNAIQFANGANLNGSNQFTYTLQTSTATLNPHLTSNTDPNLGYPDFSVITFDRDGVEGSGYGRINGGYVDLYTANVERHYSGEGFNFEGINSTTTPVTFSVAGEIAFNEAAWAGFAPANVKLGNVSNLKISGGSSGQFLRTDGSNNLTWASVTASPGGSNTQIQYNDAGSLNGSAAFTFVNTTNTVSTTNMTVGGNLVVQRAFEPVTYVASPMTGTINFDAINQSILSYTSNATGNCTLNIRGNSSVTLNTLLPTNDSLTVVFLATIGATTYATTTLTIDSVVQSVKWLNGQNPSVGTRLSAAVQSYTFTIMKTAANTYTTFGTLTEYA